MFITKIKLTWGDLISVSTKFVTRHHIIKEPEGRKAKWGNAGATFKEGIYCKKASKSETCWSIMLFVKIWQLHPFIIFYYFGKIRENNNSNILLWNQKNIRVSDACFSQTVKKACVICFEKFFEFYSHRAHESCDRLEVRLKANCTFLFSLSTCQHPS